MEIQQHDGVVVEAAGISAGLRQAQREGEVSREGEGGARGWGTAALPPPLYRPPGGAPALGDLISKGGGGQGGWLAPQAKWVRPPPLGFPTLGAGGAQGGAPAHQGLVPLPLQPMGPSGIGGPTRWTPGTLLVVLIQYR